MHRPGKALAALVLFAAPGFAQGGESPDGTVGTIPPPPPGCVASTQAVASTNVPVAIPTGPAVVSSTLTVAGAGAFLWDLNVQTSITHTNNADLDITIQSPSGTVVTLTTDNGGSNDNVYNGTFWDDDANPAGQVPYSNNNGLVNDHGYANNVLATPLVPEDALGAFIGEDPNGTWTLTISDDLSSNGGNLAAWSVEVTTIPSAPVLANTVASNNTPVAIPPTAPPNVVSSTIVVAGAGTFLYDLDLTTAIQHTFPGDLDVTLMSPAGTIVTVTSDNGGSNDNVFDGTIWNDDADPDGQVPYTTNANLATDHPYAVGVLASPLVPEESFSAFIGEDPNGTWTLTISDDANLDGGSLNSWSLDIDTAVCSGVEPCVLTCPANVTQANDPGSCGATVTYPAPGTSGQCGQVLCTPASGTFYPVGPTTVTCVEQIPASPLGGASCSFTVTVNDTQPPSITPPPDVNVGTDAPLCSATVSYPPPFVADNCPGVGVATCTPASGSSFPLGTTPVGCQVFDAAGNSASGGFDVTVFDDDPPALVCPADIFTTVPPGSQSTTIDYVEPVPTDNCPNATAGCVPPPGDAFPVGTTTVVCTATDGAGLTATCDFDVVIDELAIQEIPTASAAGLAGLALLLAAAGFVALRRRG